jgi:hypothetical protein
MACVWHRAASHSQVRISDHCGLVDRRGLPQDIELPTGAEFAGMCRAALPSQRRNLIAQLAMSGGFPSAGGGRVVTECHMVGAAKTVGRSNGEVEARECRPAETVRTRFDKVHS